MGKRTEQKSSNLKRKARKRKRVVIGVMITHISGAWTSNKAIFIIVCVAGFVVVFADGNVGFW